MDDTTTIEETTSDRQQPDYSITRAWRQLNRAYLHMLIQRSIYVLDWTLMRTGRTAESVAGQANRLAEWGQDAPEKARENIKTMADETAETVKDATKVATPEQVEERRRVRRQQRRAEMEQNIPTSTDIDIHEELEPAEQF